MDNKEDKILEDDFEIIVLNIDNIETKEYNKVDKLITYLKLIKAKTHKERVKIAKGDEVLMKVTDWIYRYLYNKKTDEMFDYRRWDKIFAKEEQIQESAINLHKNGASKELICKSLNISEKQLEEYLNEDKSA